MDAIVKSFGCRRHRGIVALRISRKTADCHVLDHAVAQFADGLARHRGLLVLRLELLNPSILKTGLPTRYLILSRWLLRRLHHGAARVAHALPRERVRPLTQLGIRQHTDCASHHLLAFPEADRRKCSIVDTGDQRVDQNIAHSSPNLDGELEPQ